MDSTLKIILDNYKCLPIVKNNKMPPSGCKWKGELNEYELKRHRQIIDNNLGNGDNYGILTGEINDLCVVDFDYKNPEENDVAMAKKLYKDWTEILGDTAVVVKSHSGGHHLYFKYKPLLNRANAIKDLKKIPIDVRANGGYIVAPPSKRNGNSYELLQGNLSNIPEMPDVIFNSLIGINHKSVKKSKIDRISKNMDILTEQEITEQEYKNAKENLPYFEKLIKALPEYYCNNYSDWCRIMIIGCNLYHASEDKKHIRKVLVDFCKQSSKYKGHEINEWIETTSLHSSNKLSINSLWGIIKDENEKVFKKIQQEKYVKLFEGFEHLKKIFDPLKFDKISKSDGETYDICKIYFEKHYCFVQTDKHIWSLNPEKKSFCSIAKLKENFSNLTYQVKKALYSKKGEFEGWKTIAKPFIIDWVNDIHRLNYWKAEICFNNCPPNILNLYDGFFVEKLEKKGIKPDMIGGKKIYDYIGKTLFRENPEQGKYALAWIAQMFQQPKNPTNTCLFIYGDKGCGKSTLTEIIKALTDGADSVRAVDAHTQSKYVYSTAKMNDIFGKFNPQVEDKLCCVLEEVKIGNKHGDSKEYAQQIKDAVTNRFVNVEKKYKDVEQKISFLRYMFISNCEVAVFIEDGCRRIVLCECSNDYSNSSKKKSKEEKFNFWKSIYKLIADDACLLGFYKLLMEASIDINWEHDRPNGKLYDKVQRKNKDMFVRYFTTINVLDANIITIENKKHINYDLNHLIEKIKKYYKEFGISFNKNNFNDEYDKWKDTITKDDESIIHKIKNTDKNLKVVEKIIWNHDDLIEWLKENNYTLDNIDEYDNSKYSEETLKEIFKDEIDSDEEKDKK